MESFKGQKSNRGQTQIPSSTTEMQPQGTVTPMYGCLLLSGFCQCFSTGMLWIFGEIGHLWISPGIRSIAVETQWRSQLGSWQPCFGA